MLEQKPIFTAMVLVTGGNGLLGIHLLYALAADQDKIRASYRSEEKKDSAEEIFKYYPEGNSRWSRIEWVSCDLKELPEVESLMEGITKIYHCAASVSLDPRDRFRMYLNNTQSTENLVNLALTKENCRFVHVSSVAALGEPKKGHLSSEQTVWNDPKLKGAYAISKYASEQIVWRTFEEGLNGAIVNPSTILGPGSWDSGSSQLFSKMYKGFPFFTKASQGLVDVRDVAKGMINLMNSGIQSERFILSGYNKEMKSLMDEIASIFKKKGPSIEIKPWIGEVAWRLNAVWSFLSRMRPTITKDMIRSGTNSSHYDNSKSIDRLQLSYRPLDETVNHVATAYLAMES